MTILLLHQNGLHNLTGKLVIREKEIYQSPNIHRLYHETDAIRDTIAEGTAEQMTSLLADIATTINLYRSQPHILININSILTAQKHKEAQP